MSHRISERKSIPGKGRKTVQRPVLRLGMLEGQGTSERFLCYNRVSKGENDSRRGAEGTGHQSIQACGPL